MVTAKKKKGQLRKASKTNYKTNGQNRLHAQITAGVVKADDTATELLSNNATITDSDTISKALPSVLLFLMRCEDETFQQVVASVRGDLTSPSKWIRILLSAAINVASCRLQIAENIGPLVSCFCNDTERLFFKSNKHWRDGILSHLLS